MQINRREDAQQAQFSWQQALLCFSFLIGMVPIFYLGFHRNSYQKAIRQAPVLTTGTITLFVRNGNGKRSWYDAYADYRIKDRVYTCVGKATIRLTKAQRDSLIGVRLPVIYERDNPTNAHLLAGTQAFNRFNFDVPDSLNWTSLYFTR